MSDENWVIKHEEFKNEHLLDRAATDLRTCWKDWIAEQGGVCPPGSGQSLPPSGITSKIRN